MMNSTTYFCKLRVLSPVHIGCDEVYEPTGFAIDEQGKELISFEPASFLGMLEQQDLDKYSVICRKGTVQSLLEVFKFIRQHKEHAHGRSVAVSDALVNHYNKTLNLPPNAVQQQLNKFEIARTSFQKVDSVPYIPGSTIKGALRTAVLNLRNGGSTHPKYRNGKQLNDELSGGTFATDPFRLIKVGDFQAAGKISQRIVYGVNKKKKPSEKEARGPYQILEVVEAGSEFVGIITVQQPPDNAGIKKPVQFDEIRKALSSFYPRELEREKRDLQSIGCEVTDLEGFSAEATLIRLGRHSGAECVTVEGHRDIKIMQGPGVRPKYKNHATTLWLAAGSDNPSTNKFLKPFGWAEFVVLSAEETRQFEKDRVKKFNAWECDQQEAQAAFKEKAELLARQREAEQQEQERLAEEQRQKDEELRKYPWRSILPGLKRVSDWGILKTQVLEHEYFKQYQAEEEVGRAVAETALRVAENNLKKWDKERDQIITDWLQHSGIQWECNSAEASVTKDPLLKKIQAFSTPADYDRYLDFSALDIDCCRALQHLFKKWNWDKKKKAKANNHKLWKALQARKKQLAA